MMLCAKMRFGSLKRFVETRRAVLVGAALVLSTLMVYWRAGRFEFLNFDDQHYVYDNPYVTGGLTSQGLSWALSTSFHDFWHPLTWWSHMLDCELFGANAGIHHLINAGFHALNTLLLFVLLQRMTGAFWRCAVVAGLFALHPTHVESVAWVAERKDVLSGLFFFLTLWAYGEYAKYQVSRVTCQVPSVKCQVPSVRTQWVFYVLAVFCFTLGLMSKPMLVTLPFVLLLFDFWPLRRLAQSSEFNAQSSKFVESPAPPLQHPNTPALRLVLEKLPFFALALASSIITYLGMKAGRHLATSEEIPWALRWANVPVSYVRYLGKLFWPHDLAILYPMPRHWEWWEVAASIAVVLVISWFVVVRLRTAPYLAVGWLIFLGMLTPVIGIVSNGFQSMADRYLYLPSIGIFVAVVWGLADILKKVERRQPDPFEVQSSKFKVQRPPRQNT